MSDPDVTPREQCQRLDATGDYTITVTGGADGESMRDPVGYGNYGQVWESNRWVRLRNVGDEEIANPWITVGGRPSWRSVEDLLAGILDDTMDDAARARTIWEFARRHRYHFTTADDEVKDTVKMLNVYGYTLCWDEAYTVSNLWQAADLRIRRGLPHGHCTTEVFFDGKYHLLDSDEHLLVLERDNETIAGEAELSRDHDLMKRSHAYGVLSNESRAGSESAAALFCHTGPRTGSRPCIGGHRMDLTLRPGEALVWSWDERGRWHGYGDAPPRYCNGRLEWAPPLDDGFGRWTEDAAGVTAADGALSADGEARLVWRLAAPYEMVGGHVELRLGEAPARLQLQRDAGDWIDIASGLHGDCRVDLDEYFPPASPATYSCRFRLLGEGLGELAVCFTIDLQMAPLSLPALRLGDNRVTYRDESSARDIEITHAWQERGDLTAPAPPTPQAPVGGEVVAGSAPTLRWTDTAGEGGDYHVRLSPDHALRWELSPVFDKLVSRTPSKGRPQWTVPEEGLLNPDHDYHWQVRARSPEGLWGSWSAPASFRVRGPGVPLDVRIDMDWDARQGSLSWRPNPTGSTPASYEIYGSHERGFTARREPYTIVAGRTEGQRAMPANLLATVDGAGTHAIVLGADVEAGNTAFFRVVAVHADGVRSGQSDYAEAPRPFVCAALPERIPAGEVTVWPLQAVHSIGDLRAESDGPHRYHTEFRDGDELTWLLDEGPPWIELDGDSGRLTFRPQARDASTHTVTVRVKNGQGGVDVIGFDLEVLP